MKLMMILFLFFNAKASFLPDDFNVDLGSLPVGEPNMDETEFNRIIKDISDKHKDIISSHGGRLSISGQWKSETLNARATQMFGTWRVEITGGLARRPELTPDGFALILCHELGHHLGGFAFAPLTPVPIPVPTPIQTWAASEGQSDYYATQVCTHKIWAEDLDKNASFRDTASEEIKSHCNQIWQSQEKRDLCYRSLVATESMILTMATLMKKDVPKFSTPDENVVDKTISSHPAVQCRMDTSLQGALCDVIFDHSIIPGKNVAEGVDSLEAEREAYKYSCAKINNDDLGLRPQCWFKSRL